MLFLLSSSLHALIECIWLIRYKFDDERVTKEDTKRALEEQYGGEEEVIVFSIGCEIDPLIWTFTYSLFKLF